MKKKVLLGFIIIISILCVGCTRNNNLSLNGNSDVKMLGNLDNYAPIVITDKSIIYNYFLDNATFSIGKYDIDSKNKTDIAAEENFYISYGIPALANNIAYLPITLNNNEHNLLSINLLNNSVENIFIDNNSEPLDSISTMSGKIYLLSNNLDENGVYTSCIRKYNDITKEMDICITNSIDKNNGEKISAFACFDGKIYAITEKIDGSQNDIFINVYDGETYNLLNTLIFDDDIKSSILKSNIAQFYSFGDYIYIRDFLDNGVIGKIDGNSIKSILMLPQLRIAYNNRNTKDEYYVFFMRESNEFYIVDVNKDTLLKSNLQLSENESIRNAISDGNNLCVSILDESNTDSYVTKETYIFSYEYLLKLSKSYNGH